MSFVCAYVVISYYNWLLMFAQISCFVYNWYMHVICMELDRKCARVSDVFYGRVFSPSIRYSTYIWQYKRYHENYKSGKYTKKSIQFIGISTLFHIKTLIWMMPILITIQYLKHQLITTRQHFCKQTAHKTCITCNACRVLIQTTYRQHQ